MKRILPAVATVALLLVAGAAWWVRGELTRPFAGFEGELFLQIERGTGSRELASLFERHGVVRKRWYFLLIRGVRPRAVLQAGEYRFTDPASPLTVFDRLVRGDVYYHSLTVPEGTHIFDTAKAIAGLEWVDEEEVLRIVRKPDLIADLAPEATSLEGFLFPSTYRVTRGTPALEICRMMTEEFRRVWQSLPGDAGVHETVTLASLVERETGVAEERELVSSVFHNRLRRGGKLECDPTVIYAAILEDRYDGVIHRSDLDNPHPYNTYQHAGLPPGPIASPGRAALEATLAPAETDFLFFVAKPDGSGGHEFSETLAAHNRAVARYRRGIREAKRQERSQTVPRTNGAGESN